MHRKITNGIALPPNLSDNTLMAQEKVLDQMQDYAQGQDQQDPLGKFRNKFIFPQHQGRDVIYFCGNSLGLQPKSTKEAVGKVLDSWATLAVEGHFNGDRPWMTFHHRFKESLARIVGAKPLEVVAMNNLTVNLHLLMVSFYRPMGKRTKIIMEGGAFPSDQYAVASQIKAHGLSVEDHLIELLPRPGEKLLRTEDILQKIEETGPELALVMMGGINYYTGQCYDMARITAKAHSVGAKAGFDLAHAAGNVPLRLHDWGVDFAAWCSYKYMNASPGGISGVFIHERHAHNADLPRFAGWWGHSEEERFLMEKTFKPMPGADGWQLANPPIIMMAALGASLEIFDEAGMEAIRAKSLKLTGFLYDLMVAVNQGQDKENIQIITPVDETQRGSQLSLVFPNYGKKIFDLISANGVIADWREPDVIRVAPAPLYNSFNDVYQFSQILKVAIEAS